MSAPSYMAISPTRFHRPTGSITVILYFSENCPNCVDQILGGNGLCPLCERIFDIEVEGSRRNGYNPADAAVPPDQNGIGETFKATEVVFESVMVEDDALNISILDRGFGNPPHDPSIKAFAITIVSANLQVNLQRPGDCNQDGSLNVADGSCLLNFLFIGSLRDLPCGDGEVTNSSNIALMDLNGDGNINVADASRIFGFLFLGAGPPVQGTSCIPIFGCDDNSQNCSP